MSTGPVCIGSACSNRLGSARIVLFGPSPYVSDPWNRKPVTSMIKGPAS